MCPDHRRTTDVLIPSIKKHVAPGAEIHTDSFKSYDGLDEHEYVHKKVNYNEEFVADDSTHTQRIESLELETDKRKAQNLTGGKRQIR